MDHLRGGCHCGNLQLDVELSGPPAAFTPRACDCDFCTSHGAAYVSDPHGRLSLAIRDEPLLSRYRQGSGVADMLVCARCGVMVGAIHQGENGTIGTVNIRALERTISFGEICPASPKLLEVDDKIARWQDLWFRRVEMAVLHSTGD